MLLGLALRLAAWIVSSLPARAAYGLADMAGTIWYRSPARRALVAANLARVCAATGRATSGPAFERLVRRAFREHARYYLELRLQRARQLLIDTNYSIVQVGLMCGFSSGSHSSSSSTASSTCPEIAAGKREYRSAGILPAVPRASRPRHSISQKQISALAGTCCQSSI